MTQVTKGSIKKSTKAEDIKRSIEQKNKILRGNKIVKK